MPSTLNPADLLPRLNRDVERSVLRARNGIRYVRGTHRPALGATPRDVVWKRDKAELWRYKGGERRYGPPVVIVHSLVSRSYILDLRPGNSTVEYLTRAGLDVFMLDWGGPDDPAATTDPNGSAAGTYPPRSTRHATPAAPRRSDRKSVGVGKGEER